MAKLYAMGVGIVLLLVGVLGFFMDNLFGLITFTTHHNLIHVATGVVGLGAALAGGEKGAKWFALIFGIVYILVTVVGFVGFEDIGPIQLHLNLYYNVIHGAVGVLGLLAGLASKSD